MSINNSDVFSEIAHLPLNRRFKKDLFKAYQKYLIAKVQNEDLGEEDNMLISKITKIAAKLFKKTTNIWDKAKKRHETRGIKSYDERYILNLLEKSEIEKNIDIAQNDVKASLLEIGYSIKSGSNCFDILLERFQRKEQNTEISTQDLRKQVIKVLKSIYKNLCEIRKTTDVSFDFGSKVEERDYYTFEKFFGTRFDKLRK